MKIMIVSNLYPPIIFGGYEILCHQVVQLLRERGHEVVVLTSSFMRETAPEDDSIHRTLKLTTDFPRPGESVNQVDFSLRGMNRVGNHNAKEFETVAKKFRPDIVFCWCLNRLGSGVVKRAQKMGIPVNYTINDEHPRQFRYTQNPKNLRQYARSVAERLYSDSTFRGVSRLNMTIISGALKKNLLDSGAPVASAKVIYQGVDLDRFSYRPKQREANEPLRILYVGQLSQVKGVHTLLRAAARLKVPFHLSIVGSGVPEYESQLLKLVQENRLQDKVSFLGRLPREEVVAAYSHHHVLVFPSEWEEPFGLTHLEAMASGCAVVSTTTGGSAELVRHGQNALAYSAGDNAELASRLEELSRDERKRRRLLSGGRHHVEENHSLRKYVTKLEEWLQRSA